MASQLRQRRAETDSLPSYQSDGVGTRRQASLTAAGGFSLLCTIVLAIAASLGILLLLVDIFVDLPIEPQSFSLPAPPEFTAGLTPNNILSKSTRLFEGLVHGPESIVVDHGHLYTGTSDGKILHILQGEVQVVASLGRPPCGEFKDEPTCGRPLGMRFDKEGYLIVADAYLGLHKVNVVTGDTYELFSSAREIEGKRPRFMNDLDIASDGRIYLTDSSTKWDRRHNRLEVMEAGAHGRLLMYDPSTEKMTVLLDGLQFPNGIQLTRSEEYLLVAETTLCRILRYYLKGEKAGTFDIFTENLPGTPDNIRASNTGGFWVGFATVRRAGVFNGLDFMANKPWFRKIAAKLFSQEVLMKLAGTKYGLVVELNKSGEIIRSLHDPTGEVITGVSSVADDVGILYLGSYYAPYMARLNTNQKF